jgi:hypothetical protein
MLVARELAVEASLRQGIFWSADWENFTENLAILKYVRGCVWRGDF